LEGITFMILTLYFFLSYSYHSCYLIKSVTESVEALFYTVHQTHMALNSRNFPHKKLQ